jgi:hypothetical protein
MIYIYFNRDIRVNVSIVTGSNLFYSLLVCNILHTLRFSTLRFTELDARNDISVNNLYSSQTVLKTLHLLAKFSTSTVV